MEVGQGEEKKRMQEEEEAPFTPAEAFECYKNASLAALTIGEFFLRTHDWGLLKDHEKHHRYEQRMTTLFEAVVTRACRV